MGDEQRPAKRFKHQSYQDSLREVHLPSALQQKAFNDDIEENSSHFHEALEHWRELNLSPAFIQFASKADALSASLPLLLHNWQQIIELWMGAISAADDEALKAVLDLLQKLCHDLRTTISPLSVAVLDCLLKLLPRSLSAATFTVLLESLSALFKYVLIPLDVMERTWSSFEQVLPKCNPEVQRVVAELWGNALRRMKSATREKCTLLIVGTADADVAAWIFVSTCKSVSQTLHTTTPTIFTPLLGHYLSCDDPDISFTVLRRLLTALAHHCKTSEQYSPLSDILVKSFSDFNISETPPLVRLLELLTVPCSVRQGSRLTAKHLSTLVSKIPSLPLSDEVHDSLLKFSLATLMAGDMALWMGPGRKVLEYVWNSDRPLLALELSGALSDLNWGGWKLIALPHILKHSLQLLKTYPSKTLELLCRLYSERRLEGVDSNWKRGLQNWVDERFQDWDRSQDKALEYGQIIRISSLLPSVSPFIIRVVNSTLEIEDAVEDYNGSELNGSWLLGISLKALSSRPSVEWLSQVDLPNWTETIVTKWGWCGFTMEALVALISSCPPPSTKTPFEKILPHLQCSLMSHSRALRLSTLQLLSSSLLFENVPRPALEVIKRCLQGEEASLDVQGVRERVLRINKVDQGLQSGDDLGAGIAIRWFLAQLKVNLRPVWKPAAEAIHAVSERFGDLTWDLVFQEIRQIAEGVPEHDCSIVSSWMTTDLDDELDSINEDEKTWRDPSAHKLRVTVASWLREDSARRAVIRAQNVPERFDKRNYELQLLSTLGECSSLAEKHSRDLVPLFLSLAPPSSPSKLARPKLISWLGLFSHFANPKALRSTEQLQQVYTVLLSHPDRPLQCVALSCMFTYKSPHLLPHQDILRTLLDDTRWRDELTNLDISTIDPEHRREFMDVLTRLLFGLMLEKKGRTRGADRRSAVLTALGGCTDEELYLLVDLMLKPIVRDRAAEHPVGVDYSTLPLSQDVSDKQLVGFLTLLGDVLKNLGSRVVNRWPILLGTLLDIIGYAQAKIDSQKQGADNDQGAADEDVGDEGDEDVDKGSGFATNPSRTLRTVRQLGLKRFADFFKPPVTTFDFSPYMKEAFKSFISPRITVLDIENTQAPSALLDLFQVWSTRPVTATSLVLYDNRTLPKIYDCLIASNVKAPVVSKVFDIVENLLGISSDDLHILDDVFKPHVSLLLSNLAISVQRMKTLSSITDPLGKRQINILSQIAPYIADSSQASTLLTLFTPLLRKPSKVLPEKIKVDLVKITQNLLPLITELSDSTTSVYNKTYSLLSYLFQTLRSRQGRLALLGTFHTLANLNTELRPVAEVLEGLNAYSKKRMDEPDFDRRIAAFNTLNENMYSTLQSKSWLPILYNMLNFIQDPDELTIRNNAAFTFRRFIDHVADENGDYEVTFVKVLYPGLKNGLRSRNELVRAEILSVISYAVSKCNKIAALQEMKSLLAGGDDEANFFNNIHHVQLHRRTRAIRRLAEYCEEGQLRSTTLAEVFIPLLGNFVTSAGHIDHTLVNEAITSIGKMAKHLAWGAYYSLVQQYLRLMRTKDAQERVYIRTIVSILDNFHFSMDAMVEQTRETEPESAEQDDEAADDLPEGVPPEQTDAAKVLAEQVRIADAVNTRLLPTLLSHLEKRDENEDTLRIPVAIGIVKVALHLPQAPREAQVGRLLTVMSQMLRSKSQETRDLVKDSLCRIAVTLGPSYLPLMLRELRGALLRGPQLHVLAYVTHALLIHVTSGEHASTFNTLDDCVNDVAHVSAEVIFGESGKDLLAEEFKTKMREVRVSTSKGLDSFALIAKFVTPPKISSLLVPIRNILHETETLRVMQQVEDLLRRIAGGLNANPHLTPKELLSLCHSLISQNSRFLQQTPKPLSKGKKGRKRNSDAIVQLKRTQGPDMDHYANNSFRFVIFGLELFNTAHRRSRFDFQDREIIARLESMVTVIGNTLYSSHIQVVIPALKAASAIIHSPLKNIDKSLPVFIRQMIDIIKQAGSTESEAAQASLKSLSSILRDQPNAQVKEKDLIFLLELLTPDLEDPTRQASVFAMLRAIVSRKFVVPEIYDIMDKVSEIMVTNQSPQVQELCRGVLLQFLLEYPQGKGRLKNSMTFFAKNLSYVYESGRKSVMDLLSAILSKFQPSLIREYSDLLFVSLVMVIANDDSAKCREMASELIKNLFARLEEPQRRVVLSHVHSWASQQRQQPQLARVSSQVYSIVIDLLEKDITPYAQGILEDLNAIIESSAITLDEASVVDNDDAEKMELDIEWQVPYHALVALTKLLRANSHLIIPSTTIKSKEKEQVQVKWPSIVSHLLFPHAWVRTASCRLIGLLLAAVPVQAPRSDLPDDSPFSLVGMEDLAKKLCLQLRSVNLDATLALEIVKNLFYIGKCFCGIPLPSAEGSGMKTKGEGDESEPEDEGEGEDDDEEEDVDRDDEDSQKKHPLPWLFSKLSYQARSAHIARRNKSISSDNWFHQPASILRWFAAMVNFMEPVQTKRFLTHILSPLYRILEDDTIRDSHMDELKTICTELQDLVQAKVGTTDFANVYNRIRQTVLGVRRERRTARAIQATANPAASAKRKMQRNVAKKDSRKRKSNVFADYRGRVKRHRED
ncbi:armadillo-type protein [Abortiporus biennis]|nr:armadillo-type protein [Abortiporus biennis]